MYHKKHWSRYRILQLKHILDYFRVILRDTFNRIKWAHAALTVDRSQWLDSSLNCRAADRCSRRCEFKSRSGESAVFLLTLAVRVIKSWNFLYILDYCEVWYNFVKRLSNKLQRLQNRIARQITSTDDNTTSYYTPLRLLPVKSRAVIGCWCGKISP